MPPASPAATRVCRIASRIDVLPWSTWPRTVTIGGREISLLASSRPRELKNSSRLVTVTLPSPAPPSCSIATVSPAAIGSTVTPNSSATIEAVSKSMTWLMVAISPFCISFLMTSTAPTPSWSERSLTDTFGGSWIFRSVGAILVATAVLLSACRAASIAAGESGAEGLRVSLLWVRKLTSSFWLMFSSRASSCALICLGSRPPGPN